MTQPTFTLTVRPDQIGVISMDVAGESMNVLKAAFLMRLNLSLAKLKIIKTLKV